MKKAAFYTILFVFILVILEAEITFSQALPFAAYMIASYLNIWKKAKNTEFIFGMSVLMMGLNMIYFSIIDICIWAFAIYAHKEVLSK